MARRSNGPWFRGTGTWYATVGGKSVSLGVRGEENEAAAMVAWHKLMSGAATQPPQPPTVPVAAPPPAAPAVTVGDLLDKFREDVRDRAAPRTVKVYTFFFARFKLAFGTRSASSIRPHDVETAARRPSWSSSTRYGAVGAIVAAFRWGERSGLLPLNPLRGVRKPPKTSRGVKAVVTDAQHTALCAAAPLPFATFLRGLWATGCRPGELAAVSAADVNLEAGVVMLAKHKTAHETGAVRAIYLSDDAVTLFRERVAACPTGPLFPRTDGTAWRTDDLVGTMRRVRRNAGCPLATCYGYRHSYATQALAHGVPDALVATLLGHVGTGMLNKHYSHLSSRAALLRDAAKKVRGAGS